MSQVSQKSHSSELINAYDGYRLQTQNNKWNDFDTIYRAVANQTVK